MRERIYLKEFILPFVKKNGVVIDIGSHIGSFAIQAVALVRPKVVFAIEPDHSNFDYLVKNVNKSRVGAPVHPIQIALWNLATKTNLYCQASNPAGQSLIPSWREWMSILRLEQLPIHSEIYAVHTDTLDRVLRNLRFGEENIALMKIDVEGAERQVLEGSVNTLRRCGVVVGELHEEFLAENDLRRLLRNFTVAVGEPFTSLRLRHFWAVQKSKLKTRTALREFHQAARVADMEDTIRRLRREASHLNEQYDHYLRLMEQLDSIHTSVSWRITAPIRWLGSVIPTFHDPKFRTRPKQTRPVPHPKSNGKMGTP